MFNHTLNLTGPSFLHLSQDFIDKNNHNPGQIKKSFPRTQANKQDCITESLGLEKTYEPSWKKYPLLNHYWTFLYMINIYNMHSLFWNKSDNIQWRYSWHDAFRMKLVAWSLISVWNKCKCQCFHRRVVTPNKMLLPNPKIRQILRTILPYKSDISFPSIFFLKQDSKIGLQQDWKAICI